MTPRAPHVDLMRYSTAGVEFICIFAAMFGGSWLLDRWLKVTYPAMTIVGAAIGFAGAMYRLVRQARAAERAGRDDDEQEGKPSE